MKTPREILFAHHSQAEPKLDDVRRKALAALGSAGILPASLRSSPHAESTRTQDLAGRDAGAPGRRSGLRFRAWLQRAWFELVWPSRRAWAGMAAVWLAVLAVNLEMKVTSRTAPGRRSVPAPELARAFEEQRRLLAELLPPSQPSPAQAPRPQARPRSERPVPFKAC
jgi:hypothetical protein